MSDDEPTAGPRCPFIADMMARRPGMSRSTRIRDVRCAGRVDHEISAYPGERDHHFISDGNVTFGVAREGSRWVSR